MKLYDLDTELTFGQYKSQSILEILKKNTTYISDFCLNQMDDFFITDEVYEAIVFYGFKGSIEDEVQKGRELKDIMKILNNVETSKDLFEQKRKFYKKSKLKEYEEKLEKELMGNGNINFKEDLFQ